MGTRPSPDRFFWLCVALGVSSCVPDTKYRRSALVPPVHALAWDGRTAQRGSLRLEGSITHTNVQTDLLPQVGDSALLVPETLLEGLAAVALTRGFELGARYGFAAYEWAQPSAYGTAPIPSHPTLNGLGPEARGTVRLGNGAWALGFAANYLVYGIPTSEWIRDDTCILSNTCVYGWSGYSTRYRLQTTDNKSRGVIAIAFYPSYEFSGGKYGHVFGGITVHDSFKNDGFSNNPAGSAVEGNGFVPVLGVGYGFHYEALRVSGMLDYPVTSSRSAVYYSSGLPLSFFLSLGVDIPLFGGERPESPPPAPEPQGRP